MSSASAQIPFCFTSVQLLLKVCVSDSSKPLLFWVFFSFIFHIFPLSDRKISSFCIQAQTGIPHEEPLFQNTTVSSPSCLNFIKAHLSPTLLLQSPHCVCYPKRQREHPSSAQVPPLLAHLKPCYFPGISVEQSTALGSVSLCKRNFWHKDPSSLTDTSEHSILHTNWN